MTKTAVYPLLVIAFLFLNGCMPLENRAAMQAEATPSATVVVVENAGDVPRTSLDEAKAHFDEGTAIFVDAWNRGDYEIEHIVGAVLSTLPVSKLGNTIPKDQWIIAYCTWPSEATSASVAILLHEAGLLQVSALLGGMDAWVEAGYPLK